MAKQKRLWVSSRRQGSFGIFWGRWLKKLEPFAEEHHLLEHWRRESHTTTFGRSDVGDTLLRLEEHAFYVVFIKFISRTLIGCLPRSTSKLVLSCPIAPVYFFAKDKLSLSPGATVDLVFDYVGRICEFPVPFCLAKFHMHLSCLR